MLSTLYEIKVLKALQRKLPSSVITNGVNWCTNINISEVKPSPNMTGYLRLVQNTGHYIATYYTSWPKTV
jgi:hypothetical protein